MTESDRRTHCYSLSKTHIIGLKKTQKNFFLKPGELRSEFSHHMTVVKTG